MQKVALVALPGCSLENVSNLLRRIQHQEWRLRVLSLDGHTVRTAEGVRIQADAPLQETVPVDFNLLIIPGGHYTPEVLHDIRLHRFIRQYDGRRRFIAAVCEGVVCLAAAQLMGGIMYSAPTAVVEQFEHLLKHAIHRSQSVTVDANIISADGTDPAQFAQVVCQWIDLGLSSL